MYDPQGSDTGREWIELFNSGAVAVTMTAGTNGWRISDSSKHVFVDPSSGVGRGSLSIPAGGYVIIASDPTSFSQSGEYPSGSYSVIKSSISLNNTGTTTILTDSAGTLVSSVSYTKDMGASDDGNSLQLSNGTWITAAPTPGVANANVSDTPADTPDPDSTPAETPSDTNSTTVTTTSSSSGGGGETTYIPPPSALTLDAGGNQDAAMDVPLHFSTRTTVKNGTVDPSAKILWGFGDGSSAEGGAVEKTYRYAGAYLVVVTATDGMATGRDEFIVTVRPAQVRILGISDTGIMIANDASERLDLSGWALFAGTGSFRIPSGTVLLPKANILFSSDITKLLTTLDVTLAYPDGVIAARYAFSPEPVAATTTASVSTFNEQPSSATVSYKQVQTVEPIISTKANVQANENAVSAPVAATELAAAGAALPPDTDSSKASPQTSAAGIFKSPWTLGFLGTVILAGAAFIFI